MDERARREVGQRLSITINDLYSKSLEGEGYGWGSTARNLSERHIASAYANANDPFVLVDLCSSYPIFAQILRERRREDRFNLAGKITGQFANDFDTRPVNLAETMRLPTSHTLPTTEKTILRRMLAPKSGDLRILLKSILTDLLYSPPNFAKDLDEEEKIKVVEDRLAHEIITRRDYLEAINELPELMHHGGNWTIIVPRRATKSIFERVEPVVGIDLALGFCNEAARYLSHRLMPELEGYSIISMDIKAPRFIRQEAERSFPDTFKSTKFFRRAGFIDGTHLRSDITKWPFAKDSVSVFTCIEGWPFYFGDQVADNKEIAVRMGESLRPGGKAIIFPWAIYESDFESQQQILSEIEAVWENMGLNLTFDIREKTDLESGMRDRELVLLSNSPVFKKSVDSRVTCMVVEKPIGLPQADPTE